MECPHVESADPCVLEELLRQTVAQPSLGELLGSGNKGSLVLHGRDRHEHICNGRKTIADLAFVVKELVIELLIHQRVRTPLVRAQHTGWVIEVLRRLKARGCSHGDKAFACVHPVVSLASCAARHRHSSTFAGAARGTRDSALGRGCTLHATKLLGIHHHTPWFPPLRWISHQS